MAKVWLRCKDKRFPQGDWLLVLHAEGGTLTNSEDIVRANSPPEHAHERFQFPSFWESVTNLGVRTDKGELVSFVPDAAAVAQIKEYLQHALAAQGSDAVRGARTKGWWMIVGGLAVTVVALVVMAATMVLAFTNPEGGYYFVTIGIVIAGVILLVRGVVVLNRANQAAQIAAEDITRAGGRARSLSDRRPASSTEAQIPQAEKSAEQNPENPITAVELPRHEEPAVLERWAAKTMTEGQRRQPGLRQTGRPWYVVVPRNRSLRSGRNPRAAWLWSLGSSSASSCWACAARPGMSAIAILQGVVGRPSRFREWMLRSISRRRRPRCRRPAAARQAR
jgi:hypothetical protein